MKRINEPIDLITPDNEKVILWKMTNLTNVKNVFLTHGTFSDKKILLGLVDFLVENGYNCWVLEWRSHGNSPKPTSQFDFETIALNDIYSSFDYLVHKLKITNLSCITHSGGGICLTMFLLQFANFQKYVDSLVVFSCQAFSNNDSKFNYTKLMAANFFSGLLGFVPGKLLKIGNHNETYFTMRQWFNWNLKSEFTGKEFDYLPYMKTLKVPIYSICSVKDKFISPPKSCETFLNSFENEKNVFECCSLLNGYREDYNHSRIILSKNSRKEIYPKVINWLISNE
jgi:poly(3-hydroxyalkanoate) synthetase